MSVPRLVARVTCQNPCTQITDARVSVGNMWQKGCDASTVVDDWAFVKEPGLVEDGRYYWGKARSGICRCLAGNLFGILPPADGTAAASP